MKTLKNKIFAGALSLTSLGFLGNLEKSYGQDTDFLKIKIDTLNFGEIDQMVHASGYADGRWVSFVGCISYKDDQYTRINLFGGSTKGVCEEFNIDYNAGFMNYERYFINPDDKFRKIISFKNLTIEQIYQDQEFAKRTERIIDACESKEKLKEMVKEVYMEQGKIKIPQIKK